MQWAAVLGHTEVCEWLCEVGDAAAQLHATHPVTGEQALHMAVRAKHHNVCWVLVQAGADPHAKVGACAFPLKPLSSICIEGCVCGVL